MARDYEALARTIIELVGGEDNVLGVTHCITRLRFTLKDESKAQTEKLNQTEGVISVMQAAGQYQVVIGNHVTDVYDAVGKVSNIKLGGEVEAEGAEKQNIVNRLINLISGIFMPALPAMSAAGLIKAFVIMCETFGWLSSESTTYTILYGLGDAVFYFLPIFLARGAAKKFNCNEWYAMAIAAGLCYPDLADLYSAGESVSLFGIPLTLVSYTSSVLPIIVAVWFQSVVEHFLTKHVPDALNGILTPLITVFVTFVATLFVVGPITDFVGNIIADALVWLLDAIPLIAGFLIGTLWPCLIIFGMHWAFIPIVQSNMATLGYDVILPITVGTNFAIGTACLAVFLKTKNKKLKDTAASAALSALLSGVTEPGIYGVCLKYKRPFIIACLCCGVCGAIAASCHLTQATMMTTCVLTIPAIYAVVGPMEVVSLLVAAIGTFILTYLFGFDDSMILAEEQE